MRGPKKLRGKAAKREAGLRDARFDLRVWDDYLEFVRFLEFGGTPIRRGLTPFTREEWLEYSRRTTGEGSPDTMLRRFERWKVKVRRQNRESLLFRNMSRSHGKTSGRSAGRAVVLRADQERALPEHASHFEEGVYQAPVGLIKKLHKEASDRVDFYMRASGKKAPSGLDSPPAVYTRSKPIKSVLLGLGIPYSGAKAKRWAEKLGMPVRIEKRGRTQKTFYYADSGEVFDWIQDAIREGKILDPLASKMPVKDARPRVKKALSVLTKTASKTQIAKLVGSNAAKLDSYIRDRVNLKFIPSDVVTALEKLVKEGLPDLRRSVPKAGAPTLVEIKEAIAAAKGNLTQAEVALRADGFTKAITASNLSQIAKRYGIPVNTRRVIEPSKKEVGLALKEHDYRLTSTAASFGFSVPPLQRLIDKYDLRGLVDKYGMGKITSEDLVDAAEAGGFVTAESAEVLGINRGYFRDLLGRHDLVAWFDSEHEKHAQAGLALERKRLAGAINRAARLGKTREEFVASFATGRRSARTGMTRGHLESRIRVLGLQKVYGRLKKQKRFVGERQRDIAPTETRVPFWLSALRELRARYPGRGGGRRLAAALGYGNATISNWLSGNRVPGMPQIRKIMSEAKVPMPDWMGYLGELVQEHGTRVAAARSLGVLSIANILAGRTFPSEKLLERILGDEFWVTAQVQPDTGHRPGASMGEVPSGVASTHLAAAMVRLLGTVRSQRELAGLLGVSPASISRFMRAKVAAPPPRVRDAIVALYEERFGELPPGIQTQHSGREDLKRALKIFPTQTALAEELGLTRGHLSRIISGDVTLSPRVHVRLEELLKDMAKPNPPRFDVRSPAQGFKVIQHPVITRNYEKALRVKPKHKKAVLVPCAGTKPFPDAPSHKSGYLEGLKGKKLDVYVVSEPLGIVPYEWSRKYPQESYDFPPHHLRGPGRDLLVDRIADWFERGPRYEKIYLALPGHHRRLVLHALEQFDYPPTKIKDVGLGACLESGSCPPGHVRPTTKAYRKFLKARANPEGEPSCPDCERKIDGLWRTGVCDECKHILRSGRVDPNCGNCLGTGHPVCCRCEGTGADPWPEDNPPELGNCYQDALNYIMRRAMTTGDASNLRLVHATVTGQGPIAGVAHGHAWAEELQPPPGTRIPHGIPSEEFSTVWAIDREHRLPAALYRFIGKARDVKSYTYAQACRKASKYSHFGPWPGSVIKPNPPPHTAGLALFGRHREPVEVVRPAWSGDKGYWDVVFEDGSEGIVSEIDLYTTGGDRWRVPVRKPGRQAWANNPFGLTYGQIAGKVVGWTATGAVADVITSRINRWITRPVARAAEGAIVKGARAAVGKNPRTPSECGSPPKQVGVHVVDRPWGRALLVLDVSNLKAYTARDWADRGCCPLLAAFSILDGEGAGTRVARDSMHDELAHHEASDHHYRCSALAQLALRCGIPLEQAEDLLCQEGAAWYHAMHGSASGNP